MDYVLGFLFNKTKQNEDDFGTKVALIKKNKPEWQKGKFNGIGGKIELGETPIQAMIREFEEEAGIKIEDWREFAVLNVGGENKVYCFSAVKNCEITSITDEEVFWFDIYPYYDFSGLCFEENVLPNLKWLIPMAQSQEDIYAKVEYNTKGGGS